MVTAVDLGLLLGRVDDLLREFGGHDLVEGGRVVDGLLDVRGSLAGLVKEAGAES